MKKILSEIGEHIVNGIKYTIPLIVVYSVFSAIIGAGYISVSFNPSDYVFLILVPVLTAFIAHSICPKITFLPGLVLGYYFGMWQIGYIGGILGGLIIGYLVLFLSSKIKSKNEVKNIVVGYFILGIIGFAVTYLLIDYLARPVIIYILDSVHYLIVNIPTNQTVIIVIVLAFLTTLDLGGPFNKLAYGFIIQFYADGFYHIIGPVLVSVMLPPLGVFLGLMLLKNRFSEADHKSTKLALFGSVVGLTEGALAVGYRRPVTVLPILIAGSVVGSTVAFVFGLENTSLLVSIPSLFTINNIVGFLLSITAGVVVMLLLFYILLKEKPGLAIKEK